MPNEHIDIQERFSWTTSVLDLQAASQVLEIGCGAGILVTQIAGKLSTGTTTAIDRSGAMIKLAAKRNQAFITTGKVTLMVSDFLQTQLPKAAFDKIIAFNVNFFWKGPAKELLLIKDYLKPGGQLFIFYQAPYSKDTKKAQLIKEQLQQHAFQVKNILEYNPSGSGSAFCIVTTPEPG